MKIEPIIQTRREFLRRSLFFLATSYSAPFFLTRTVLALDSARANAATASLPACPRTAFWWLCRWEVATTA